jgi:flagellar hook assembly protein FlgD
LRIYNSEGKLIFTPQSILIGGNGIVHYDWNGRDREHKLLPLGLYICYLEVVDVNTGKKSTAKAPIVIGAPLK